MRIKCGFRQLQIRRSSSTCHSRRPPCVPLTGSGERHCRLPLLLCRWLNFFSYISSKLTNVRPCALTFCCAPDCTKAHKLLHKLGYLYSKSPGWGVSSTKLSGSLGCWGQGESWMCVPYLSQSTYQPTELSPGGALRVASCPGLTVTYSSEELIKSTL